MAFDRIWALALIPLGMAAVWLIDRKYGLGRSSLKRRVSRGVRMGQLVLLALAVAAPSVLMSSSSVTRWVLMDASDSAAGQQAAMEAKINAELESLPQSQQAGVMAFGTEAMVEVPLRQQPAFTGLHTQVDGADTDLDAALRLAAALTPSGSGGITVLTDGKGTVSQGTLDMLASQNVTVDALILEVATSADAQLTELNAPAQLRKGQSLTLQAVIDASEAMTGTLVLYQNGSPTATRQVELKKGENRFAFSDVAKQTGIVTYSAQIVCEGDCQPRNNSAAAYVQVLGAPCVALISEGDGVEKLFEATGMAVESLSAAEMPVSADGYLNVDAIILNNIPYDAASETQWQALESAVTALGRGLCVLGGDSSYALGGYRGTLLEELLPVTVDVREKLRMPALSLVVCIDKSGSMTAGQFGSTRIEVAKEAAMSALEVLNPRDWIGVIGFDSAAKWVVPFQNAIDVAAIQTQIGTLRADGGTAFYSALEEAYLTLQNADTPQKHVIFLSDGEPAETGFQSVIQAMQQSGITLTTVAVGNDADQQLMKQMALIGGGRCYTVGEFDDIPQIFTKETMLVSGSYVQNRTFTPVITEGGNLTDFAGFPTLDGYLSCAEKNTATVSLVSDTEEPLLARWNAGAGKVIAWTSDAEGAWTNGFLQWADAPRFFGGLVAQVLPGQSRQGTLEAKITAGTLHLCYTVDEETEGQITTKADVLSPDGQPMEILLLETAPGQYEGEREASAQGAYALRVTQEQNGNILRIQEGGAVAGFSGEYDLRNTTGDDLQRLCQLTGGRVLTLSDSFWDTPLSPSVSRKSLQEALCGAALCLLLIDIALRRLPWEEAVAKWLKKPATVRKESPSKPEKSKTKKSPEKQVTMEQNARQTASTLLEAKRARERK